MRFTWLVVPAVLSLSLAGFAACSSSSTPAGTGTGTGSDASPGDSSIGPGSNDSGIGPGGGDAGTDSAMPMDSGVTAPTCSAPAACAATEVCCGTIPITGGTVPNCTTGPISTTCAAAASCATKLGAACSGTQTVRLCTMNADCTEPADNSCCTFGGADGGLTFCASAFVAALGGGVCK